MDEALEKRGEQETEARNIWVGRDYDRKLREVFLSYGHYLEPILHDRMKELLHFSKRAWI